MMRKWRCAAATMVMMAVLSAISAAAATSLQMAAELPPDNHLIRIALVVTAIITVIFAFAKGLNWLFVRPGLVAWEATQEALIEKQNAAMKVFLNEAVVELGRGFEALMDRHIDSGDPHPDASKRMHGDLERADMEILAELKETKRILHRLVRAHNAAMLDDRLGGGATLPRDPADSPYPARDTDEVGSNHTGERGKHKPESLLVNEEENEP